MVALPVGEVGDMALATEANGRSGRDVGKSGERVSVRFVVDRCGRDISLAFARGDETEGRDEMTAAGRRAGEQAASGRGAVKYIHMGVFCGMVGCRRRRWSCAGGSTWDEGAGAVGCRDFGDDL